MTTSTLKRILAIGNLTFCLVALATGTLDETESFIEARQFNRQQRLVRLADS